MTMTIFHKKALIGANWPSLPIPAETQDKSQESTDSPIQPVQKSPTAWKGQQRGPEDNEKNRVGRYAKYFKGNEILPIPEIVEKDHTKSPLAGRFRPKN